jgi:FkbM family methyltransferase
VTDDPLARLIDTLVGRLALDIGANRGDYTKQLAARFDRVSAFEPDPGSFKHLKDNLAGFANVQPVNQAVSDSVGFLPFYRDLRPELGGLASSVHDLKIDSEFSELITVPCTTIDNHCRDDGDQVAFIKIDVEGHEPAVFAGARETIRRWRPVICFEFWETWYDRGYGSLFKSLFDIYDLTVLQTGESVVARYELTQGRISGTPGTCDILCRPRP